MRSENEIRAKIEEYMGKLSAIRPELYAVGREQTEMEKKCELYYGIIDALLWIIGDESGAPI